MSDLISRQDAIRIVIPYDDNREMRDAIEDLPSIQPEQQWHSITEIPPYGKDLMLKLHDRRRGCDCSYYFVMGFYGGKEYHTYLFNYQNDHDLEVVGWQLCPWKGEQE